MRGRIVRYNEQKGYGFIRGEDGAERFFHISGVKSFESPSQGMIVEFMSSRNEKGLTATDIRIQVTKDRPAFVVLGDTRIKLTNIKSYGMSFISAESQYEQAVKEFERKMEVEAVELERKLSNERHKSVLLQEARYNALLARQLAGDESASEDMLNFRKESADVMTKYANAIATKTPPISQNRIANFSLKKDYKEIKYLYITTYQGDNHTFYQNEVNFDIYEKCNELDDLLG